MINRTTVLLIQNDLQKTAEITEKCIEAGIYERNIFSVTDAESAERYLEIAGISYVVVDADMYNFVVSSAIEKFSEFFPIQTIITNAKPEQKTLRMLNDKTLTFINDIEEIPSAFIRKSSQIQNYRVSGLMN